MLQAGVIHTVTGDAFHFWRDPTHRERMLRTILEARGRQARSRALHAVDNAITQGMAALGFPRAPIRSLSLASFRHQNIAGLKYSTCELQIGVSTLRRELRPGGAPDAIVETWIHESVHGRQFPWGEDLHTEFPFRGFEEGLAEGVTRLVSRQAGLVPGLPTYGRYVQTYDALAHVLGVSTETIYRSLYHFSNGSVMRGFATAIDAIRSATGHPSLTLSQRDRLEGSAKRMFARAYFDDVASAQWQHSIRQTWRRAFR